MPSCGERISNVLGPLRPGIGQTLRQAQTRRAAVRVETGCPFISLPSDVICPQDLAAWHLFFTIYEMGARDSRARRTAGYNELFSNIIAGHPARFGQGTSTPGWRRAAGSAPPR